MKKNEIIEQVDFCVNLTNRLKEAVVVHEEHRASKKEWNSHSYVAEGGKRDCGKGCFQDSDHGKHCPASA